MIFFIISIMTDIDIVGDQKQGLGEETAHSSKGLKIWVARARGFVEKVSLMAIQNGLSVEGGPLESSGLSGGQVGTDRLRGLGLEQRVEECLDCIVCVFVLSAGDGRPGGLA